MATVSALAISGALGLAGTAKAEDADHPLIWIDLGGDFDHVSGKQELYDPPFLAGFDHLDPYPVLPQQRWTDNAFGDEVKISYSPSGSKWVFSAGVRYGRSSGSRSHSQQWAPITYELGTKYPKYYIAHQHPPYHINSSVSNSETHGILDFKAGKDVGLGLFSGNDTSLLSLGVRIAQFTAKRNVHISGVPDFFETGPTFKYGGHFASHHRYIGDADTKNSFRGIGPSISWDDSVPIAGGGSSDSELSIDWGVEGAVLFGKQKVRGHVNNTGYHYKTFKSIQINLTYYTAQTNAYYGVASSYHNRRNLHRSRSVVVPNVGGFAAFTMHYGDAKVSFGYRADMFFGAMDSGVESRHSSNRAFYGPYASISIGIGD